VSFLAVIVKGADGFARHFELGVHPIELNTAFDESRLRFGHHLDPDFGPCIDKEAIRLSLGSSFKDTRILRVGFLLKGPLVA